MTPALANRLGLGQRVLPRHMLVEVTDVLARAAVGRGRQPRYMTAYQILQRLDPPLRVQLIRQYGTSGKGAGHYYGAATSVAKSAQMLEKRGAVRIDYIDTHGIEVGRKGRTVEPGYSVCGIYRLR